MTASFSKILFAAARKAGPKEELSCQALLEYASTTKLLQTELQRELAQEGLTEPGFRILAALRASGSDALYRADLGSVTGLSPMHVENAVFRLETSHLVDRHRDPVDRRMILLRLTQIGRERVEHALHRYLDAIIKVTRFLDLTDLSACLDLSAKIRGGARIESET